MSKISSTALLDKFLERNAEFEGLIDNNFPVQKNFILDPARRVAANCTRRGGKSSGLARRYAYVAKNFPGTESIYFGLTAGSARDILWNEVLELSANHGIRTRTNKVESKIYFPQTRSSMKFAGADASEKEMRKVLGKKYKLAGVDEAGSFTIDMVEFLYQKLEPTLIDLEGTLMLVGTCEMIPNTFFESVSMGKEPGWSVHRWTTYDNPYLARQWDDQIKRMIKENPRVVDAAWFKTHYLNQWVTDDALLLVKIQDFNIVDFFNGQSGDVSILGVDLGWNDSCAFSVVSYNLGSPTFTVRESWKQSKMDFTDVANAIREIQQRYDIIGMAVDGANKQGVEEMKKRHNLPLEEAEKSDKMNFLRMLSDDFKCGRGQIIRSTNKDLVREWSHLIRNPKNPMVEDPRCENHLSDATLYAWRKCFHYGYTPAEREPTVEDPGYEDYLEQKRIESIEQGDEWWNPK